MFATTTSSPIDSGHVEAKLPCSNSLLFPLDGLAMNLKKGYGRRRRLPAGQVCGLTRCKPTLAAQPCWLTRTLHGARLCLFPRGV
jgi:hypothetical protein